MKLGKHLTVDGMDGVGKSTFIRLLMENLGVMHKVVVCDALKTNAFTKQVRSILVDSDYDMDPKAKALLLSSVHIDNYYNFIDPLLKQGINVVSDRSIISTMAYQGFAAMLKTGNLNNLSLIEHVCKDLCGNIEIIITGTPTECIERCKARSGGADKIESAGMEFHQLVNRYFENRPLVFNKLRIRNTGTEEQFISNCMETIDWLNQKLLWHNRATD